MVLLVDPWYPPDEGGGVKSVGPWWESNKINFDGGVTVFCKTYEDIYVGDIH